MAKAIMEFSRENITVSKNYRFHLLSLSHLPQNKMYSSCAFTQKNRKFAKMLVDLGHEVFFYGSEGSDVEEYCNSDRLHFVQTHTIQDIADSWGDGDNRFEIQYDWYSGDYRHDFDKEITKATLKFYANSIENIAKLKRKDDFLLCTQGYFHKPIVDAVKLPYHLTIESGIGYRGSSQGWHRVFESAYIKNFTYGSEKPFASMNGDFYDRIIPNYFDPDDVEFSSEKEDYYLFCARLIRRKGILEAHAACKEIGAKLLIVGQGGRILKDGTLTCQYEGEFDIPKDGSWEYLGFKGIEERKHLMAKAKGFFSPTEYLECFGGSHVEALLSGTPVLTTNFGVYETNDTFINGLDGFACDTLDDFVWGAQMCEKLDPLGIRKRAERFLMDNVKWEYQKLFEDLYYVYESSLDDSIKGWSRVRKQTPEWRKHLYPELMKK
jgi:glycosyltransferase involved in cell wall biosynthesis